MDKLFYITQIIRPDIDPTVAFVCTRVEIFMYTIGKIKIFLSYIKGTINDRSIIGSSILKGIYTWVDSVYTFLKDMQIHTGGATAMAEERLIKVI